MIHYREDLKQRWLVLVYQDPYTADEWREAIGAIFQHALWRAPRRLLVDRRYCSAPSTPFIHEIERFIAAHPEEFNDAHVAVVVSSDVGYGVTRMHENIAAAERLPIKIRAFRDWEEAEHWLAMMA